MLVVVTELNSCSEIFQNFAMVQIHISLFSDSGAPEMGMIWPKRTCLAQCLLI